MSADPLQREPSPPPPPSKKALWCFWLGLSTLICFGGILIGLPTVIMGHLALAEIKRSPTPLGGAHLAYTGLVLGYIGIVMSIIMLVFYIMIWSSGEAPTTPVNLTE